MEKDEHQMKRNKWEQDQIKHMKNYNARFGHSSAKLARQAKSKEKSLARMQVSSLPLILPLSKVTHVSLPFLFSN